MAACVCMRVRALFYFAVSVDYTHTFSRSTDVSKWATGSRRRVSVRCGRQKSTVPTSQGPNSIKQSSSRSPGRATGATTTSTSTTAPRKQDSHRGPGKKRREWRYNGLNFFLLVGGLTVNLQQNNIKRKPTRKISIQYLWTWSESVGSIILFCDTRGHYGIIIII